LVADFGRPVVTPFAVPLNFILVYRKPEEKTIITERKSSLADCALL
jgi:hypothetical protein